LDTRPCKILDPRLQVQSSGIFSWTLTTSHVSRERRKQQCAKKWEHKLTSFCV